MLEDSLLRTHRRGIVKVCYYLPKYYNNPRTKRTARLWVRTMTSLFQNRFSSMKRAALPLGREREE